MVRSRSTRGSSDGGRRGVPDAAGGLLRGVVRPVPAPFAWADPFLTVGVTGTNGKTSTSHLLASILSAAGRKVVCQSTLGYFLEREPLEVERSERGFYRAMQRAAAAGVHHAVVEVTSKALAGGYARKWRFDLGVFTNLSRDHVAEHGSWEHYLASKAQLFVHLGAGSTAVLNACDEGSVLLDHVIPADVRRVWYGAPSRGAPRHAADLAAARITPSLAGTRVELAASPLAQRLGGALDVGLVGEVYGENALAAAALALSQDIPPSAIHAGLAACSTLPGRFEVIHDSPLVVLDYAHSPDALARVCDTARTLASGGRLIVVFGAAGGYDGPKREAMGAAVASRADLAFVTDENPRHEDPARILDALLRGGRAGRATTRPIPDRSEAIRAAVNEARPGDLVLITGRGRDVGMIIGDQVLPYSDVDAIRAALASTAPAR